MKDKKFHLSREDFLKGNYRIMDGILAGKKPITTDCSELVKIHGQVLGIIDGEKNFIQSTVEKQISAFVDRNAVPEGYVHFAGIEEDGKIFILKTKIASELDDIEKEIRELHNEDFFTNKIFR